MSQNDSLAAGAEAAPDKATFIAKKTTAGILALLMGGREQILPRLHHTGAHHVPCVYYWRNIDMRFGMHPYRHHSAD